MRKCSVAVPKFNAIPEKNCEKILSDGTPSIKLS